MNSDFESLIVEAVMARDNAYAPYSHFTVGAALLTNDGKIFTGCNIENASYPAGICAERTAFSKAVSEGYREFTAVAIAGGAESADISEPCPPCGICRQFMREFCSKDFSIILPYGENKYKVYTLDELLPESFGPDNLK